MGKTTGFLEYPRVESDQRLPEDRIKDWNEIRMPQDQNVLRTQGARCMNCGVPFCQSGVMLNGMTSGCPLHNLIPEFNDLVYKGQWKEAYQRLIRTNPFPEFTARVCPAPCEGACTVGYLWEPVTIKNIEYEIIEKAFAEGWVRPAKAKATGYKVAVVGSGPAGLAAAHYLNAVGHDVTIFERDDRPGGLLMYGIPNIKLDKSIIARRIELMQAAGIKFVLNTEIGTDLPARDLAANFDAVILCAGAGKARRLQVEGHDLKGVYLALEFLRSNTKSLLDGNEYDSINISARDKNVIVIGGGDTGTDCVATAIRQHCKSIHQFEIQPEPPDRRIKYSNPWPEWPRKQKVDYGQEEAISISGKDPRHYLLSTKKIEGDDQGRVQAVYTVDVNWFKNSAGILEPVEVPGSEKRWPADLVLLALGFAGPEEKLLEELQLKDDKRNVLAEYEIFETSAEKVFAAGDMRRGQSLIAWAIQEGKLAAREVDKFLTGNSTIK
ncbi:MAG TPA: glutamate synthase subunit beta [Syntrophomonadaceae bacterium]|nr:glutamate synthase subunit beta [Syntrophomonadaceae bacterium]HRX21631.1 glutamate synthase subunit beta [Syntrophomonadaceae bacterium]